jgi:epoxyqueuosine reductase QueG
MSKVKNYNKLKKFCLNWGADLFGVARASSIKDELALTLSETGRLSYAISLGVRASTSILAGIQTQPTRLYFHHYRTINMFLDQLALRLSNFIQDAGFKALPIPASQIVDWQKQTAHLSHKKIGFLAGLGWMGRNNLLVNRKLGSQFRLTSVLTDMPLKSGNPTKEDCGKCRACMVICPVNAIKEGPADFDHLGCFTLLKEFQRQRVVDQYICGICVKACRKKNA